MDIFQMIMNFCAGLSITFNLISLFHIQKWLKCNSDMCKGTSQNLIRSLDAMSEMNKCILQLDLRVRVLEKKERDNA